jgi:8-oxo-dGTP pyrophosphatase MutT (NUDIX family)
MQRRVLEIADELRAIATTGLHFTDGEFDRERYERLLALAARLGSLASEHAPDDLERIYRSSDAGYVTPKLDVRLALFRDARVLLVRERADGRWSLPGGYVDVGDSPAEAAAREASEEAGVEARAIRLAGIWDRRLYPDLPPHLFHIFTLVFAGELVDPRAEPRAGSEATDAAFHPIDTLPELSRGRTQPRYIEAALRVLLDPAAHPHFD